MTKNKPGYLLLILLIVVAIIAVILVATGSFKTMLGSKKEAGTVNYQVNDMQQKVDDYNKKQAEILKE